MTTALTTKARYPFEPDWVTEPGEHLQETLEVLGLTQRDLAKRSGYTTKHVNWLISGKARISPDAALRLERVTNVPARIWNNLESQYQRQKARLEADAAARAEAGWLKELPLAELRKRGILPKQGVDTETVHAALSFFGFASVEAWSRGTSTMQVAFRKSTRVDEKRGHLASWVRMVELEARGVRCSEFRRESFVHALTEVRGLTRLSPSEFVPKLKGLCADAGVAVVLVPEIPGTGVAGVASWLGSSRPVIGLNPRTRRNDSFWFTFFHEAGHILNDGRDETFVDIDSTDEPRERAANEFASHCLIPPIHSERLPNLTRKPQIAAFAAEIGVHPAIVLGRLQHDGIVGGRQYLDLTERLDLA
jgi:HTH-type transcriptional regulator / antitoxin HigA